MKIYLVIGYGLDCCCDSTLEKAFFNKEKAEQYIKDNNLDEHYTIEEIDVQD